MTNALIRARSAALPELLWWRGTPARMTMLAGLVAVIAIVPALADPFILHLLNSGSILAIAALALTVLTGTAGLLSLGTAAFMAIGAFSAGALASHAGAWLGAVPILLGAGVIGMVIGGVLAIVTIRALGIYLAVGTVALHYLVELILTDVEVKVTGANGYQMPALTFGGWEVLTETQWWYVIVALLCIVYVLLRIAVRGPVGNVWAAAREVPAVAAAMGVSQVRARAGVFMATSFITALAGALSGYYSGVVQIGLFPFHLSIVALTIVVLGGAGNLVGAVLASYLLTGLPHFLSHVLSLVGVDVISRGAGAESIVLGLCLVLVLLRWPQKAARWFCNAGRSRLKREG